MCSDEGSKFVLARVPHGAWRVHHEIRPEAVLQIFAKQTIFPPLVCSIPNPKPFLELSFFHMTLKHRQQQALGAQN